MRKARLVLAQAVSVDHTYWSLFLSKQCVYHHLDVCEPIMMVWRLGFPIHLMLARTKKIQRCVIALPLWHHQLNIKVFVTLDTGTQNRCLLHKPYVNEVNLSRQYPSLKCCQLLKLFTQYLRDLDLSMLKMWGLQIKGL